MAGMESYLPSRSPLVPDSLLAGVLGGVGFMVLALALLLGSACLINHKRNRRRRRAEDGKEGGGVASLPRGPPRDTLTLMNCIMNLIIYSIKY